MKSFWSAVNNHSIVRRIVIFVTLYMTWIAFYWAAEFAETSDKPGLEIAAIIAAVIAPVTALQGFVFKVYTQGRR